MGLCQSRNSDDLVANLTEEHLDTNVFDKYKETKKLGIGSIGSVSLVTKVNDPTTVFALKSIITSKLDSAALKELRNEINIMKQLDHPNIVHALETFEQHGKLYVVMELCQGGDLYKRLPYSPLQAAQITSKIVSAVAYMHKKKIVHRDLKFENILFESEAPDAEIKIIDFGLSTAFAKRLTNIAGTVYTMAPEVLQEDYTEKADCWSIGVLAYMLLSGEMPFTGKTARQMAMQILHRDVELTPASFRRVSQEAKDFIANMMQRDPDLRMSASEALNAPWLANHYAMQDAEARASIEAASELEDAAEPKLSTSMRNLADGLSAFGENQKLKKLALMFVARQASTQQIEELRKAFNVLDVDRTGIVTSAELRQALEQVGYETGEIETIFQGADIRSTGQIEYTEFIAATLAAQGGVREEHLRDAFDRIDTDKSGLITKKNLQELLGTEYDSKEVDTLISESDLTGNGAVSYREFIALFYKGRSVLETNGEGLQVLVNRPSQGCVGSSSGLGDVVLTEESKAEEPEVAPAEPEAAPAEPEAAPAEPATV